MLPLLQPLPPLQVENGGESGVMRRIGNASRGRYQLAAGCRASPHILDAAAGDPAARAHLAEAVSIWRDAGQPEESALALEAFAARAGGCAELSAWRRDLHRTKAAGSRCEWRIRSWPGRCCRCASCGGRPLIDAGCEEHRNQNWR